MDATSIKANVIVGAIAGCGIVAAILSTKIAGKMLDAAVDSITMKKTKKPRTTTVA